MRFHCRRTTKQNKGKIFYKDCPYTYNPLLSVLCPWATSLDFLFGRGLRSVVTSTLLWVLYEILDRNHDFYPLLPSSSPYSSSSSFSSFSRRFWPSLILVAKPPRRQPSGPKSTSETVDRRIETYSIQWKKSRDLKLQEIKWPFLFL